MSTYTGRLLRVDLITGSSSWETLPPNLQQTFVGGRGFGIHYLWEEMPSGVDPLGPENKLVFLPGALAGTSAQGFGRWIVRATAGPAK